MSWGIDKTGTKEGVKRYVSEELDRIAKCYEGKPEADDVRACRDRILALVDATKLGVEGGADYNALHVSASGSHYSIADGIGNASFRVDINRVSLAL